MSGLPYRPCPVVLAAPSGTGKTSIARRLVAGSERFVFSVSATTRAMREGERDGTDYEFVDPRTFRAMIEAGELAEWAEVHGTLYGTPRRQLDEAEAQGRHVVLDIDVQGARQIRKAVPHAVLIFIFPPSGADLLRRLGGRGTEREAEVLRRLRNARGEMDRAREFDYVVVNDELQRAVERVREVVRVESLRPLRIHGLESEVARLKQEIDEVVTVGGAGGSPTT